MEKKEIEAFKNDLDIKSLDKMAVDLVMRSPVRFILDNNSIEPIYPHEIQSRLNQINFMKDRIISERYPKLFEEYSLNRKQ